MDLNLRLLCVAIFEHIFFDVFSVIKAVIIGQAGISRAVSGRWVSGACADLCLSGMASAQADHQGSGHTLVQHPAVDLPI